MKYLEVKFIETECRMVVAGAEGGDLGSKGLMGTEFQFAMMEELWRCMVPLRGFVQLEQEGEGTGEKGLGQTLGLVEDGTNKSTIHCLLLLISLCRPESHKLPAPLYR